MENVVLKKDLLEYIATKLKGNSKFDDFNILKNNKTLVCKDEMGSYRIELNTFLSYDLERKEASNEIVPYFYRKFNALHDWFKKHSVLSSSDYRDRASIIIEGKELNIKDNYHFLVTNEDLAKDFEVFMLDMNKAKGLFMANFKSLKNLFEYEALPILENKKFEFNPNEFDDYFIILKLVYLISPEQFDELNERVFNHFKAQNEEEHPHAMFYFPNYRDIIKEIKK